MFVDRAIVEVKAGTGGSGAESFRRERGVPRGGPNGGDGGKGGDIILVADDQLTTLLDFRYKRHYKAERGVHGGGSDKTGRGGEDSILRVPPGTIIRDADTQAFLGELIKPGDSLVVAYGGRGGRGNARFTSDTRQAPRHWESGREGEERTIELELKLIADVGLVGEPNAGKSTFLATVSKAQPKVADYPFTTLTPNLGVVQLPDFRSFVIADIPGIIEGAHEGKGLGLQFLRHIERTRTLALMVPLDSEDPQAEYELLRAELASHSKALAQLPHCVVLTKADLLPDDAEFPTIDAPDSWGSFVISSIARKGVDTLMEGLWEKSRAEAARDNPAPEEVDESEWWTP